MYEVTSIPLVRRTRHTLRSAELGFTVTFAHADMYLIEASVDQKPVEADIDNVRYSLFTTLEVAPE